MEVKFDVILNRHLYGIVEQTILRLVLRGIDSAQVISELLWVFSSEVKANAIQKLVNNQLLRADLGSKRLFVSDCFLSVIEACHQNAYSFALPDSLTSRLMNETVWIDDRKLISLILKHIVPGVDLDVLAKSLIFSMDLARCNHDT